MRKALFLVLAAVLALIALPAVSADATPSKGDFGGCYSIKKPGRYDFVGVGARVTANDKGQLRVHGLIAVTKGCKMNGVSVHRITIIHSRLRNVATGKVVKLSGSHTSYQKGIARSTTGLSYAHCGVNYQASVRVSYSYTDGAHVHPFWVHGTKFTRC